MRMMDLHIRTVLYTGKQVSEANAENKRETDNLTDDARESVYVGVDFLCLLYEGFSM